MFPVLGAGGSVLGLDWRIVLDALQSHPRALRAVSSALSDGEVS